MVDVSQPSAIVVADPQTISASPRSNPSPVAAFVSPKQTPTNEVTSKVTPPPNATSPQPRSDSGNEDVGALSTRDKSSTSPTEIPSQLLPSNGTSPQLSQPSSSKRKLDDAETDDPHNKIRRVVRDHVSQDPARVMPMATVVCLHAAVAQKSYGSEKRFLCPPPVVHIEGPVWHMRSQQLSMAVVSETGERTFEQKAPIDSSMTASFKFLHVGGTAKAKSFQLSLDIAEPPPASVTTPEGDTPMGRIWATFDSAPVAIISKPSKKTAKTRNISSCILAGGPVSLFNRINSQTVRTKYMTIDNTQLCASNVAWSAFNVNVVRRPNEPPPTGGPQPVTYGCEIILSDTQTGISTAPLVIRKVDKGRVSADDGGPVSQMQKIVLQRVNVDGSRHYLSAASPSNGVTSSPTSPSSQSGTHPLLFQTPRVREESKDGVRLISDEVDDYLCWTIVGISKFQYTFFDAFSRNSFIPVIPMTPFPTLFTAPVYRASTNTVELTVSNFFYQHPTTRVHTPLDIYLGNIGPLRHRVYHATPGGALTSIPSVPDPATLTTYVPPGPTHTVVMVDMPPVEDVMRALREDALPASPTDPLSSSSANGDAAPPPPPPPPPPPVASIMGRSLPLLFIRSADGVGYHSGRTITCENVFQGMPLPEPLLDASGQSIDTGWLTAAATVGSEGPLHGWTLRIM